MASKTSILSVRVVSDTQSAQKGLEQTASAVERFEKRLDAVTPAATITTGAIVLMGKEAVDAASRLEQSTGAVSSVFGNHAKAIYDYAQTSADSVGLASSSYQDLAAVVGSQLKSMGVPMEEIAGQTNDLIGLASDLAATFGGETSDAVAAVSSLLRGERDPIEKYGVSIKAADIEARLAAQGLDKLEGAARKQAETQATLALLMEQTRGAQGAFAREANTAAGAQARANAAWENAKAQLGEHLLPAVTALTQYLTDIVKWITENDKATLAIIATVGAFSTGILALNAGLKAYQAIQIAVRVATNAWKIAQVALNFVLSANPIGLVVTAIAALVTGVIYAYNNSETFRNGVNRLWEAIKSGASWVGQKLQPIVDIFWRLVDAVKTAYNWVADLFSNVKAPEWLSTVAGFLGFSGNSVNLSGAAGEIYHPTANIPFPRRRPANASTGTVINITVNGALDPHSVARQIKNIINRNDRALGGVFV